MRVSGTPHALGEAPHIVRPGAALPNLARARPTKANGANRSELAQWNSVVFGRPIAHKDGARKLRQGEISPASHSLCDAVPAAESVPRRIPGFPVESCAETARSFEKRIRSAGHVPEGVHVRRRQKEFRRPTGYGLRPDAQTQRSNLGSTFCPRRSAQKAP